MLSPVSQLAGCHPEDVPAYAFSDAAALTGIPTSTLRPVGGWFLSGR